MTKYVGIDVSAKQLNVKIDTVESPDLVFPNTPQGHRALIRRLTKKGTHAHVCLEATGIYSLSLALALHKAPKIEVAVINPLAARRFAEALMERSKDDSIDAAILLAFCKQMHPAPWTPPARACFELRALTRRIASLTRQLTREKNRLHVCESCDELPLALRDDSEVSIAGLEQRIARLTAQAREVVEGSGELRSAFGLVITIGGIAEKSGLQLLGELCVLPADMKAKQWVAHAGLDPRRHISGTSIRWPTRISKRGNAILRSSLYVPAMVAVRFDPHVKEFYERLLSRGKTPKQGLVAVMRKLLHAIHGVLRNQEVFDARKCFPIPQAA
jgi:transposase